MMTKRKLTFLVMPSNPERRAFSISFGFSTLAVLFFAFGFILIIASAGAWSMYRYHRVAQRSYRVESDNRSAKSQIQEQNKRIEYLNQEMLKIREKAGYIQNYLGLKPQSSGSAKIGQGGVELPPQSVLLSHSFSSQHHQALPTRASIHTDDFSPQGIDQLDADLQQIIGALQGRQEKLDHTPSLSPVDPRQSWISSPYGMRTSPFTDKEEFHPGIDIAGDIETPILAPAKGIVAFVGKDGSLGMTVRIRHDSEYETTFGHLKKAAVKKGQHMERGEVIGYMGNSGRSTGPHLHYEVAKNGKRVNPFEYMMDWSDNRLAVIAE
jgi:murein DD-endopeptidase MepM/ murein hydrolase activator NlpD